MEQEEALESYGAATSTECPKGGWILLIHDKAYQHITMPTTCKSWRCLSCRERVKALLKLRVVKGCSILEHTYLITLTFKTVNERRRTADSVAKVWARWLRLLEKKFQMKPAWLRILEATKKGQPHIHLVMGHLPTSLQASCTGKTQHGKPNHRFDDTWLHKACECLEHIAAQFWYTASGDSYVVDCRDVVGAHGAAAYLAKYLTKAAMSYDTLYALGFRRRWSRSRNWPGGKQLQLRATVDGAWKATVWMHSSGGVGQVAKDAFEKQSGTHHLLERVGDDLSFALDKRATRKRTIKTLERIQK